MRRDEMRCVLRTCLRTAVMPGRARVLVLLHLGEIRGAQVARECDTTCKAEGRLEAWKNQRFGGSVWRCGQVSMISSGQDGMPWR